MIRRRTLALGHLLLVSLAACGGGEAPAAGATSASPAGSGAATSKPGAGAAAEAPAAPPAEVTRGEVEMRDGKKVPFSIELPPGLRDVSERGSIKQYALEARKFDGYSFQVMEANPKWTSGGLEKMVAEAETSPDAVKNKAKILDKGTTEDGWHFASSIEEGTKKAVISLGVVTKGDVTLMCRGNVEGPLADRAEESARVILQTCKTLKITS
jgi:hypothetical protein